MAQRELRHAAAAKFSRAADMLFTRAGYEQSSSETIARYRVSRLAHAAKVADLCCGIGGDLIALAEASEVLGVDRDETHARLALHNAAVYGRADRARAVVEDVRGVSLAGIDAVFIDPARRSGGNISACSSGEISLRARGLFIRSELIRGSASTARASSCPVTSQTISPSCSIR